MEAYKCKSAILFICFNRPVETRKTFQTIKKAEPKRLYISCDGPRANKDGEIQVVNEVRQIFDSIDWDCELFTLFGEKNLGSGLAPSNAVDWFFKNEKEGIIIEDDCLAKTDFFRFCDWALDEYRDEKKVFHICGNNYGINKNKFNNETTAFVAIPQVWGWASWSDRWAHYIFDPDKLINESKKQMKFWLIREHAKKIQLNHLLYMMSQPVVDRTWDYQWVAICLNNQALTLVCSSNLIENIGGGELATRTAGAHPNLNLPTENLDGELRRIPLKINTEISIFYERKMMMGSKIERFIDRIMRILTFRGKFRFKSDKKFK